MSSAVVRLFLAGSGFLITMIGLWLGWRAKQRLVDKRMPSVETALATAVILFGPSIAVLGSVRTDGWSTANWITGISFIVSLFCAGIWLGVALEMRRQQRSASREARPPIESNGAQA